MSDLSKCNSPSFLASTFYIFFSKSNLRFACEKLPQHFHRIRNKVISKCHSSLPSWAAAAAVTLVVQRFMCGSIFSISMKPIFKLPTTLIACKTSELLNKEKWWKAQSIHSLKRQQNILKFRLERGLKWTVCQLNWNYGVSFSLLFRKSCLPIKIVESSLPLPMKLVTSLTNSRNFYAHKIPISLVNLLQIKQQTILMLTAKGLESDSELSLRIFPSLTLVPRLSFLIIVNKDLWHLSITLRSPIWKWIQHVIDFN